MVDAARALSVACVESSKVARRRDGARRVGRGGKYDAAVWVLPSRFSMGTECGVGTVFDYVARSSEASMPSSMSLPMPSLTRAGSVM